MEKCFHPFLLLVVKRRHHHVIRRISLFKTYRYRRMRNIQSSATHVFNLSHHEQALPVVPAPSAITCRSGRRNKIDGVKHHRQPQRKQIRILPLLIPGAYWNAARLQRPYTRQCSPFNGPGAELEWQLMDTCYTNNRRLQTLVQILPLPHSCHKYQPEFAIAPMSHITFYRRLCR